MTDATNKRRKLSASTPAAEAVAEADNTSASATLPPDAPTASEDVSTDATKTFRDLVCRETASYFSSAVD